MGLLRTQEFIKRSKAKYGDTYDYSLVDYKDKDKSVNIICKVHGVFPITPRLFLEGSHNNPPHGCPRCEGKIKDFVEEAKKIHGDKYDYSESVFVSSKKPIDIICKKHNYKFTLKRAQAHLQGSFQGCPICSKEKRELQAEIAKKKRKERKAKWQKEARLRRKTSRKPLSEEEKQEKLLKCKKTRQERFLKKAKAKYGDTYDYSLVEYQGRDIPVKIICKVHDVFPITPRTFLFGSHNRPAHGCPKCEGIIEKKSTKITQDDFLQAVREKHGEKWDLSTVQYRNKHQILGLSCPDCNESFNTTPEKLMDGLGCPRCEGRIKDLRYYVEEAKKVHGDKYDYSECYLTYEKKHQVLNNIRCKKHGLYSTRADIHIKLKCKCPKCNVPPDKLSPEQRRDAYIRRAIERHGEGRFDYSQVDYHRKRDKVKIRCILHDYWFYQSLEEHTKKRSMGGCPLCSETTGEKEVRLFLEKKKLEYTAQLEIENIRPDILKLQYMRVDFYVKKYRLIIEYNGEQHYKNCGWYKNSKRNLEMQQLRDEVLREYCQKFDFNLLEIKYSDFDNIGKLIDAKIKEIKANQQRGRH